MLTLELALLSALGFLSAGGIVCAGRPAAQSIATAAIIGLERYVLAVRIILHHSLAYLRGSGRVLGSISDGGSAIRDNRKAWFFR